MESLLETPTVPVADTTDYRYWAFISYSHRDAAWAKRLHVKLETWAVPAKMVGRPGPYGKLPSRLFPIFIDREEISGGESLDEVICAAVKMSRYLIVICSPNAVASKYVNEEIRLFKMLGRGSRIIYLIVDGEPNLTEAGTPRPDDCFPRLARHRVNPDGSESDAVTEPLAADVRRGKDGWGNATLKILARLLNVEFDDLKHRDVHRRRRARAANAVFVALACLLLAVAGIAAADAGLQMPGCDRVRTFLDHQEWSVFRHVPPAAQIRTAARSLEDKLHTALWKKRQDDGWINDAPPGQTPSINVMAHNQALTAISGFPGEITSDPARLGKLMASLDMEFRPNVPIVHGEVKWGWGEIDEKVSDSLIPLWMNVGLGRLLQKPAISSDPALRAKLLDHQRYTHEALRLFQSSSDPGAWNLYPYQTDPKFHSVYASTVALMALSEAYRANVPWDGSIENRDRLLRQTAAWLISRYRTDGLQHGWVNNANEEHVNDVYDGLTAETYAALMLAEQTDARVMIPESMREDIRRYLIGCATRPVDFPVDAGAYQIEYRGADGVPARAGDSLRYLWWPWVVRAASLWLADAEKHHLPVEQTVEVRRTLAHLVIDIGPAEVAGATKGYSYLVSEDLTCLEASFPE